VVALAAGCDDHGDRPRALVDGSRAAQPTVELEGVSGAAVATKVTVLRARTMPLDRLTASCLRAHDVTAAESRGVVVERIGVDGASVTFASAAGLHACDGAEERRSARRRWCGIAFGVLRRGRLDDPRLDMAACRTASGDPVAFVWLSVPPRTRYVAVAQDGYDEVYERAGHLPIRIATTTGIEGNGSRTTFRLSEHDARGRLLGRYELDAVPAG
jgi:hypothetical protein